MEEDFSRTEEAAAIVCNHGEGRVVAGEPLRCLGEDAHTPPVGGRILLRELESRPRGPRMMPCIRLGRHRGYVVEDHEGPTSPLFRVSDLTTREDAGGRIQVTPEPRALRCPYSVLSFDRIGQWWGECKMLGLGQEVRVSDPREKRYESYHNMDLERPCHRKWRSIGATSILAQANPHLGSTQKSANLESTPGP